MGKVSNDGSVKLYDLLIIITNSYRWARSSDARLQEEHAAPYFCWKVSSPATWKAQDRSPETGAGPNKYGIASPGFPLAPKYVPISSVRREDGLSNLFTHPGISGCSRRCFAKASLGVISSKPRRLRRCS